MLGEVGEHHAVEMVNFVLKDARQPAIQKVADRSDHEANQGDPMTDGAGKCSACDK